MRISDWSSDVCSSDLASLRHQEPQSVSAFSWTVQTLRRAMPQTCAPVDPISPLHTTLPELPSLFRASAARHYRDRIRPHIKAHRALASTSPPPLHRICLLPRPPFRHGPRPGLATYTGN